MKSSKLYSKALKLSIYVIPLILTVLFVNRAEAKWVNWTKVFEDRVNKMHEKEARFNASLLAHPNVMKNYINNVAASQGITNFNAFNYSTAQLLSKQFGQLPVGAANCASGSNCSGVFSSNSGSFALYGANGATMVNRTTGTFWTMTVNAGSGSACVGWGCMFGNVSTNNNNGGGNNVVTNCNPSAIQGVINLASPANLATISAANPTVKLDWSKTGNWGVCCGSCDQKYLIYFGPKDSALQNIASVAGGTTSYNVAVSPDTTYSWFILASNGDAGWKKSDTWDFTVLPGNATVEGYIWDSTGASCTASNKDSKEIQTSDLSASIIPTIDSKTGTWDPSQSGKSYTINEVPRGTNKVLCASLPAPKDKPGFKYTLSCLNNSSSGVFSGACSYIDTNSANVTANLGYKLSSSGWYQVLGADVYAGCSSCIDSVSLGIPDASDILGGFADTFIDGKGALFANSDFSIKNPSGTDKVTNTSGNKYYSKNMSDGKFWPEGFTFSPPSNAETINSNCSSMFTGGSLNPDKVYKSDINCVQSGIDAVNSSYKLSKDGVAIVFVTGGNTLTFSKDFKSEGSKKRVIFVTEGGAEVSKDVGYASPTKNSDANIQASIIAKQSVKFLTGGSSADTTLVVEGPVASKEGNVDFARDRGASNAYPGTVVKYNPIYMTASLSGNSTNGLGAVNISWTINN